MVVAKYEAVFGMIAFKLDYIAGEDKVLYKKQGRKQIQVLASTICLL